MTTTASIEHRNLLRVAMFQVRACRLHSLSRIRQPPSPTSPTPHPEPTRSLARSWESECGEDVHDAWRRIGRRKPRLRMHVHGMVKAVPFFKTHGRPISEVSRSLGGQRKFIRLYARSVLPSRESSFHPWDSCLRRRESTPPEGRVVLRLRRVPRIGRWQATFCAGSDLGSAARHHMG
jgi:hypothetical protein